MEPGTKVYDMDKDYKFTTYTFLGYGHDKYNNVRVRIRTEGGYEFLISEQVFKTFNLSKIDALTRCEENLSRELSKIHKLMRKHKAQFNPLSSPDVIYVVLNDPSDDKHYKIV